MATYRDWDWRLAGFFKAIGAIALMGSCAIASGNPALAQVTPDATLGAESSRVTSPRPGAFQINGGATRGTNLFHSFSQFSVPTNGFAYFNNAVTIENIISRVTGASVSNINGLITANGTANLFLINPNGIIFGRNAQLNVGGSFVASTANSLVFDNDFEFSATNPQTPPLLTINVPLGLQFGANPGRIVNQSIGNGFGLQVQPGRTLALVGGEVALEGGLLFAPDGGIELGSVAGNNRLNLTPTNTGYALNYRGVGNFQDIRLTQEAFVTTSGEGGGSIQVQGRNVTLTDGSQIRANVLGAGVGGGLTVNASESVQLIGTSADGQFTSGLFAQAGRNATGDAGDLTMTTGRLLIRDGARVSASTFGSGKGGSLTVNATDSVQAIGISANGRFASTLSADALGTGDAGNMTITTGRLLIRDGAQVSASTRTSGKGGNLTVDAFDSVQVIGTSADGWVPSALSVGTDVDSTGDAGDLTITTRQLLIRDGAWVSADTFGSGNGGNLTVNASESVQVIGIPTDGQIPSLLSAKANRNTTGNAGDLRITTSQLLIRDGAFVSAGTFGSGKGGNLSVNTSGSVQIIGTSANGEFFSYLSVGTNGTGDAGNLTITTGQLLIRDGAFVTASTSGSGKPGILTVNASDSVQVIGRSADGRFGSKLSSDTDSTNDAGNLTITTGQLLIRDGAQVSTATGGSGKGGNLTVNASDWVQVINRSLLTAQTDTNSTGDAGELRITTSELLIQDRAEVSASTFGSGKGGNLIVNASDSVQLSSASGIYVDATAGGTAGSLTVETGQLSVQNGSLITVSSPFGQAGNLNITANSLFLNRGSIIAETAKSRAEGGANINLKVSDLWLMRNESLISANAYGTANGGNINIDTQFLVALPPQGPNGSDIIANASRGNGGRINITTQGLFGIEFRDKLTPENDITASSDFGLDGEVIVNQPDVDPRQGLTNLPTDVVDATRQIDNRCTSAGDRESRFVVTGRGGLPPSPTDPLTGEAVIANWVTLDSEEENTNTTSPEANPTSTTPKQLVEAQGWVYGSDGQVILVAEAPTATPVSPWQTSPSCDDLQTSGN